MLVEYINPATGQKLGEISSTSESDVLSAFRKSQAAWDSWSQTPLKERLRKLALGQTWLKENLEAVVESISLNNGKPKTEAMMADVSPVIWAISHLERHAKGILARKKISIRRWMPWKAAYEEHLPLGVVGIISPWNYPFSIPMGEVLTALVAGNTVLLKPSEVTTEVNFCIQKFMDSCQLPDGVFQILHGGASTGAALSKLPLGRLIFTGSVNTGKKIMAAAAENLTPVSLELGGKDPAIVFEDSDLDVAASGVVVGGYFNNGQTCCSLERLLVHESIADLFVGKIRAKLATLRVGPSLQHSNDIGPITYTPQKAILKSQLDALGPAGSGLYDGKANYLQPTLVQAQPGSRIWDEESFGPVLVYDTFRTEEEAIRKANQTSFGLGAVIWTKDHQRAMRVSEKIQAGTVVINDAPHTHALFSLPWGGLKNSGFGRVHGAVGLTDMCRSQIVSYDRIGQWKQFWWFPYSQNQFSFLKDFSFFLVEKGIFKKFALLTSLILRFFRLGPRL